MNSVEQYKAEEIRDVLDDSVVTWPVRNKVLPERNRLEPIPKIHTKLPSLQRSDSVMTLGSCFASNLLKYLSFYGIKSHNNVYQKQCTSENIHWTNIYTPGVFLEFIRIADHYRQHQRLPEIATTLGLVEASGGLWFDLMFTIERGVFRGSKSEILRRREYFFANFLSHIFDQNVIILTLGLAEAWFDLEAGGYVNATPRQYIVEDASERFEFRVLQYNQIYDCLAEIIAILQRNGISNNSIIFTVSPVPLLKTFREQDVVMANMYSKSVLRASIDELIARHERVYYFPSFEMVSYTNVQTLWTNDLRHVTPRYIAQIVAHFCQGLVSKEQFPCTEERASILQIVIDSLSHTNDTPDNDRREIHIGEYQVYPEFVTEEQVTLARQCMERMKSAELPEDDIGRRYAALLIAIHEENRTSIVENISALAGREHLLFFESSFLAGYALHIKEFELTIQIVEKFVEKLSNREFWQADQQLSIAYAGLKQYDRALRRLENRLGRKSKVKWVLIDARGVEYLEFGMRLAVLLQAPERLLRLVSTAKICFPKRQASYQGYFKYLAKQFKIPHEELMEILDQRVNS